MTDSEDQMTTSRSTDPPVTVARIIPSWGIVTVIGAIAVQAGVVLASLSSLSDDMKALKSATQSEAVKVAEHEVKLADHDRRLQSLEQRSRQ